MGSRYRRFPSLQSLIGFEAAARLGSFSRAAEELSMTQSAVSHQIRALEELLGQAIFRREGRTVQLTDAGRDMLETAQRALGVVEEGLGRLDYYVKPGSVVITCPAAFARHWLLPKLPELKQAHPDIDPWIVSSDELVDFSRSENDMYVQLLESPVNGLLCELLAAEVLSPLCTPAYRKTLGRKRPRPADLLKLDLIHDESWDGWNHWFEEAEFEGAYPVKGTNFSDPGLALDAALTDQGVVLGSHTLAREYLSTGKLVELIDLSVTRSARWFLVGDPTRIEGDAERRMWSWLRAQAQPAYYQ